MIEPDTRYSETRIFKFSVSIFFEVKLGNVPGFVPQASERLQIFIYCSN